LLETVPNPENPGRRIPEYVECLTGNSGWL
jgi:hypothetical protein